MFYLIILHLKHREVNIPVLSEMSADSKENIGVGRSDRRKPRRVQNTQRMPRSVSEEVLALEGKFQASVDQDNAGRPPQGKRSRRSRRRGGSYLHLYGWYTFHTFTSSFLSTFLLEIEAAARYFHVCLFQLKRLRIQVKDTIF